MASNESLLPFHPSDEESSSNLGQRSSLSVGGKEAPAGTYQRLRLALLPEWMSRDVSLLIGARTCISASRALAGVVVPIYLALIGFSALQLGMLFVVVALTSAILSTAIGILSDRIGRKLFLITVPLLTTVSSLIFAKTQAIIPIFIFASLGSFGRGAGAGAGIIGPYQPAEQAWLAEAVPAQTRNVLFGRVAFASSLGALIGGGPLIGLVQLLQQHSFSGRVNLTTYRLEFLAMAGLALAAGLLAMQIADAQPARARVLPAVPDSPSLMKRRFFEGWLHLSREARSVLGRLWITNSVNGLAVGFFGPFITYWFYQRYGAGPSTIGLLYSIINLATMVSNLGAARIAARLGLIRAIVSSRALQAILMLPMVLAPTFGLAGACYLVRMLAQRVALPLRQSYVMGILPTEERGAAGALSNLPMQASSAASPALAGYLFDHVSLSLPFEIGAFLQGVNALLFWVFFRRLLPPEERTLPQKPMAGEGSGVGREVKKSQSQAK